MAAFTAADLSPLLNGYTIGQGPPKAIMVPTASALAGLRDVTVTGTLLKKQLVRLDPQTGKRSVRLAANNGALSLESDGDLHFCLGTEQLQPHIPCELQNARSFISTFR